MVQAHLRRIGARDLGGPCDMLVCNPPYRRARSGRINPHPQKAVARHEIAASLRDVAAAAARLMRKGGKMAVVYPAQRTADLIAAMRSSAVEPKTLRMIHSRSGVEAKLVFVEGAAGGRPGMNVAPPLVVYRKDRSYTPEVETMLQGR